DRGVPQAWRLHERVNVASRVPVLPMVVLAQAWRGGPQPRLSRALRGCRHIGVTEPLARYVAKRGPPTASTQWWLFSQRTSTLLFSPPPPTTGRTSVSPLVTSPHCMSYDNNPVFMAPSPASPPPPAPAPSAGGQLHARGFGVTGKDIERFTRTVQPHRHGVV